MMWSFREGAGHPGPVYSASGTPRKVYPKTKRKGLSSKHHFCGELLNFRGVTIFSEHRYCWWFRQLWWFARGLELFIWRFQQTYLRFTWAWSLMRRKPGLYVWWLRFGHFCWGFCCCLNPQKASTGLVFSRPPKRTTKMRIAMMKKKLQRRMKTRRMRWVCRYLVGGEKGCMVASSKVIGGNDLSSYMWGMKGLWRGWIPILFSKCFLWFDMRSLIRHRQPRFHEMFVDCVVAHPYIYLSLPIYIYIYIDSILTWRRERSVGNNKTKIGMTEVSFLKLKQEIFRYCWFSSEIPAPTTWDVFETLQNHGDKDYQPKTVNAGFLAYQIPPVRIPRCFLYQSSIPSSPYSTVFSSQKKHEPNPPPENLRWTPKHPDSWKLNILFQTSTFGGFILVFGAVNGSSSKHSRKQGFLEGSEQ